RVPATTAEAGAVFKPPVCHRWIGLHSPDHAQEYRADGGCPPLLLLQVATADRPGAVPSLAVRGDRLRPPETTSHGCLPRTADRELAVDPPLRRGWLLRGAG